MPLCRLLGYHPLRSEALAKVFWDAIVAHRSELAGALERDVHLRVAALDLIALGQAPAGLGAPVLISPLVLRGILRDPSSNERVI